MEGGERTEGEKAEVGKKKVEGKRGLREGNKGSMEVLMEVVKKGEGGNAG